MIERQTIDGREATIAYFDDAFMLVDKGTPGCLVKVLFDDGEMVLLRAPGQAPGQAPEPAPPPTEDDTEHQHDGGAWAKHRIRTGQRKTLKIHGHTMAVHARRVAEMDAQNIHTAISVGLTAGEDNTDIAHRVVGSRRLNGVNGATETTRQHIYALGRGLMLKRKNLMRGQRPE